MQQPQRRILVTYKKKHSDGTAARSVVAASRIEQSPEAKRLFSTTAIEDKGEQSASGNADPLQAADTTAVLHTSIEQPELISAPHSRQSSPSKLRRINRMKVSQGPSSTSSANSQKETNEPIPFKQKQEELDLLRPVKKRSKRAESVIADEGKPPLIPPSNNFTSASFTSSVAFQTSSSSSHLSSDRSTLVSPSHLSKSTPHSATTSKTNAAVALTYAKSRSFLQAASDADDSVPDRSGRRTGGGNTVADDSGSPIDEGLDTSDDDEEKKKELRGVHELKESGKATRFTDEIEYITSGLGPHNPIGMRRSSYLELASKSLNPQFLLKARAHNVLIEFCEFLDDSDQIITSISIFIIFIMCQDRRNIDILVEHEKLLPFIIKNYKLKPDVLATLPRSKYERNFVLDFKRLIESSNLLLPHQVSNTCIGILCLEIFIGISSSVATPSLQNLLTDADIVGLILQNFEATCARSCPTPKCVALAAEEKTKGGGGGTGGMNCGTSAISLPLARRQTTAYFKLLRRLFVGESSISLSTRHRSSVWGSVLDALSCWFRDFQKVSLQGVVDSVSSGENFV
ncbi:wings apart-like protein regulation of heterochromatin-domain-containing protein [Obelidium mucronatum]|nr:wings apart-like protein regulation of heterochromatin-domain-containing protein [Obelidium mucronatum]